MNEARKNRSPLVRFENVSLGYSRKPVLEGLTFNLRKGDFLGLVGPNGAGKSTIVKALLGLMRPLRGRVVYEEELHRSLRFGYVPQRYALDEIFPLTVEQIVRMARYHAAGILRRPRQEDEALVEHALEAVNIVSLRKRRIRELSGGQRQRTLIARALATGSNCLVLDEPTDGMDLSSQEAILNLVARLHREEHLTIVFVSHLLNEVANFVDRLALIDDGRFEFGTVNEIMTDERLTALYRMPVKVDRVGQASVVVPEDRT